jgi:hypothetical protein
MELVTGITPTHRVSRPQKADACKFLKDLLSLLSLLSLLRTLPYTEGGGGEFILSGEVIF